MHVTWDTLVNSGRTLFESFTLVPALGPVLLPLQSRKRRAVRVYRMQFLWTGMLTPSDFVRVTSTAVAETFNIYPRKGLIAPGSDADIIILDPSVEHTLSAATHHSAMDTNIYEGRKVTGKVRLASPVCEVLLSPRVSSVQKPLLEPCEQVLSLFMDRFGFGIDAAFTLFLPGAGGHDHQPRKDRLEREQVAC